MDFWFFTEIFENIAWIQVPNNSRKAREIQKWLYYFRNQNSLNNENPRIAKLLSLTEKIRKNIPRSSKQPFSFIVTTDYDFERWVIEITFYLRLYIWFWNLKMKLE
jgi:hypothetical protein